MDLVLIGFGVGLLVAGLVAYLLRARARKGRASGGVHEQGLEEFPFYPFVVDETGQVSFDADAFNEAVEFLVEERNERAARELIIIGEQNLVRDTFPTDRLNRYKSLYEMYHGDQVVGENDSFLENYRRLVTQIGRSFPHTGIEILLHNLVNPSRSLVVIENGQVTGRSVGSGATNLVLDLKTRRQRGEDKVNYELNIGARQFKCTTIPIFRPDYGLVGAVCINVDSNFIRDVVVADELKLQAFVDNMLRTDFELDENILSADEYQSAIHGKRHYLDEAIRGATASAERKLAAILFSDIVDYTRLMGSDEVATLQIVDDNAEIHRKALKAHGGRVLKTLGDGVLASFDTASGAVAAARDIQKAVAADGRFQLRIGIHLGEVVLAAEDVHGDGVNIASRIQGVVDAGQIGVSKVVYDNIKNKDGVRATHLGDRELKNVARPVGVYVVTG